MATLKVVLVGQTPPPYGGQAVMIENTLRGRYRDVELHHVRLASSRQMHEVGTVSARKLAHLLSVIARITVARLRWGATVLYYPPSGPLRVPMYRDLVVLLCTRWMFRRTVFHFQAGGLSELYPTLHPVLQALFRRAYFGADLGIRTSPLAPRDPEGLCARREMVVLNGVEDTAARFAAGGRSGPGGPPTILFVGVVSESKGVLVLLEACAELARRGRGFRLRLAGSLSPAGFGAKVDASVTRLGLGQQVELAGVLTGIEKDLAYDDAAVVCLPTFFECETFGLVLVEAMQFGRPVVSTRWRGIPAVVTDGREGFLVPPRNSAALADRLQALLDDPDLARRMGEQGRRTYESRFTLEHFHQNLGRAFDLVRGPTTR